MRIATLLVAFALGGASLGLVACGGGSSLTSAAQKVQQQAGQGRRGGFFNDPTLRACLTKHGVTLPNFRAGRRFRPPTATNRTAPRRPPSNGRRPNFDPARFAKLRAALAACGVTPPGQGAPGAAAGGGGGAPAPSAAQ